MKFAKEVAVHVPEGSNDWFSIQL